MEIGGYFGMEKYSLPMLHEGAIALNCARNCLAYLIEARCIKRIAIPTFLCDSVLNVCNKYGVEVIFYSVGMDFSPKDCNVDQETWLYIVNYYGQISNKIITEIHNHHCKLIIDNVQAYFQPPIAGIDTIYTCRKYFGVSDGAFLYTDIILQRKLGWDSSADRMAHILGRYEKNASSFYNEYVKNEKIFDNEPIKRMSKITDNILHSINYEEIKNKREYNFEILKKSLDKYNLLDVHNCEGSFMYPLYLENGVKIRSELVANKVYIPVLWPDVIKRHEEDDIAVKMANNILPISVDQRYSEYTMVNLLEAIVKVIERGDTL